LFFSGGSSVARFMGKLFKTFDHTSENLKNGIYTGKDFRDVQM
jgi:hypothetical protein